MSENLTSFGPTFQMKVIASLLEDPVFTQTVLDILKPIYFESDANRWIVDTIVSYFMEYKTNATLEVLKVKIDEIENDILKAGVVENLKEAWRNIESPDLKFIKEETAVGEQLNVLGPLETAERVYGKKYLKDSKNGVSNTKKK